MKYTFAFILTIWFSAAEASSTYYVSSGDTIPGPVLDSALYRKGKTQRKISIVLFISGGTFCLVGSALGLADAYTSGLTASDEGSASTAGTLLSVLGIVMLIIAIPLLIAGNQRIKRSRQPQSVSFIPPPVVTGAPRQNGIGIAFHFGNMK